MTNLRGGFLARVAVTLVALAFCTGAVYPPIIHTVIVQWIMPSEYTDGTPLLLSAITMTRIQWGTCADDKPTFGLTLGEYFLPGPGITLGVDRPYGKHCFRFAVRVGSAESEFSETVSVTIPALPRPPSGLTIVGNPNA